jgi:hypothetical protein
VCRERGVHTGQGGVRVRERVPYTAERACKASADILPAQCVTLQVGVYLAVPQVLEAPLPWQQQVLHQKVAGNHTHTVVTPAHRPQLPHACAGEWTRMGEGSYDNG